MSTKALATTLIVFALLVGVALYLNKGGPQSANSSNAPTPVFQLDPADITSIRVTTDARTATVARSEAGGWEYRADDLAWPVRPDAPNDMLRILSNLTGAPTDQTASLADDATTITATLADGSTRTIEVSNQTVGGRSVARTDDGTAIIIDEQLLDAATRPGPAGWRVANALPGAGPIETSRLIIETPDSSVALARVEGVWQMRAPIAARADTDAVNALLQTIAEARADNFIDAPDMPAPSIMQLDAPAMVITNERDRRTVDNSGNVRVETQSRELRLGGPASPDGATIYAAPDATPTFVMVLNSDLKTNIPTSPRHYLATNATGVRAEDVWMVIIQPDSGEPVGRRRHLDEWFEIRPDGSTHDTDDAPVAELLTFLTETPGEADIATADMRSLAKIDLLDSEGGLLDRVTVGYTADGQLMARSGRVMWTYPQPDAPELLMVPSFADLPAILDRPEVPAENPDSPIQPK